MEACGITSDFNNRLYTVNFWTSHEALHLPFEESMTRVDSTTGEYHDTSAHFVWIGDRTRQLDGGHVEFCTRVWKGTSTTHALKRFTFETLSSEAAARRYLTEVKLEHLWDAAFACEAVEDEND